MVLNIHFVNFRLASDNVPVGRCGLDMTKGMKTRAFRLTQWREPGS